MDVIAARKHAGKNADRLRNKLLGLSSDGFTANERQVVLQVVRALARYATGENRLRDETEVFSDLRIFARKKCGDPSRHGEANG